MIFLRLVHTRFVVAVTGNGRQDSLPVYAAQDPSGSGIISVPEQLLQVVRARRMVMMMMMMMFQS